MGKYKELFIDFETYYSTEYSLSRMTTQEYVLDPQFEIMGAAWALDDEPARWISPEQLPLLLAALPLDEMTVCAHNTLFDGAILRWKYGVQPRLWADTMGMAQALLGALTGRVDLGTLADLIGRKKDKVALMNMRGKRLADIDTTSEEWKRYCVYGVEDTEICRAVYRLLRPNMPDREMIIIDTLLRMYFDNEIWLDENVLAPALAAVRAESARLLAKTGLPDASALRSPDQFAELLRSHGVTPPTKISPKTGKEAYAFAKTDLEFVALLEHEDPWIQAMVEAKLDASSSLDETRAVRFQRIAALPGKVLKCPLRYSAAHTHRFGGSDRLNLQNLRRGSELRNSMRAPEGKVFVVVDASQIEARILSWIAGAEALRGAFARREDVYSIYASKIYGFEVNKKDYPDERFVGKTGVLGLGYGTGKEKFQFTLLTSPYYDGNAPIEFCEQAVMTYRTSYPEVPEFWRQCEGVLHQMAAGYEGTIGPVKVGNRQLLLPSGLPIYYPKLHFADHHDFKERGYRYWSNRYKSWKKIYGAALTENIVQALARIQITDTMLYMRAKDPRYFCALQVHDELAYLVDKEIADQCYEDLMFFICRTPSWADPSLPLAAEGGIGYCYGDAK